MGATVQNTLTQMEFPARRFRDDEEIADSDFEEDEEAERPMKRRKGARTQIFDLDHEIEDEDAVQVKTENCRQRKNDNDYNDESEDNVKVETKSNRRRSKRKSDVTPKLEKQNTITQMGFLSSNMWPGEEEVDVDSLYESTHKPACDPIEDEERDVVSENMQLSSIRASTQLPKCTAHDREERVIPDSEDILVNDLPPLVHIGSIYSDQSLANHSIDERRQRLPMPLPLPHTPQKVRVLEVPSSQTPQATPISISSYRSTKEMNQSTPTTPTPVRTLKFNSATTRASAKKLMPKMELVNDITLPSQTNVPNIEFEAQTEELDPITPTKSISGSAIPPRETVGDKNPKPAETLDEVTPRPKAIMAPPKSLPRVHKPNQPPKEHYTNLDTQTQTSQATKRRIHDFNQAWAELSEINLQQHQSIDRIRPTFLMGAETQLEFMNDDLETCVAAPAVDTSTMTILQHGAIKTSLAAPDAIDAELAVASSSTPLKVDPSVTLQAMNQSQQVWQGQSVVLFSQESGISQQSRTPTEDLLDAQLDYTTYPDFQHVVSDSQHLIVNSQGIAFSQASTVPGTPRKSQHTFQELTSETQASERHIFSLITSTPEPPEQTILSSPIPGDAVVEDSQFDSQPLPEGEYVDDEGEYVENDEGDYVEDNYTGDDSAFKYRRAHNRPAGISQLLPSSMLNSDIPLPPRWQDSIEVDQ
jgi:hypothetical protein